MTYATIEDIERRWRKLTVDEQGRAEVLLEDATTMLKVSFDNQKKDISKVDANLLTLVCCNMVSRVLDAGTDTGLYSAKTESAGVYSQTFTYAHSGTGLFITRKEKALLGLSGLRISTISYGGVDVCDNDN